ncbi:MAG: hypothetical protein HUU55_00395 [Myxococcales bacterium]|nr:hypothetical protein [Myxococcales bacterium]
MTKRIGVKTVALGTMVILCAQLGCEGGKEDYLACPMDPKIAELGLCTTSVQGVVSAKESCAVTQHPQCPNDICLTWAGSKSFCSETCDTDADCPAASSCLQYGIDPATGGYKDKYCVKADAIPCLINTDCPQDAKCVGANDVDGKSGRCEAL